MDTDEDGLIWITEPALHSGSIQDTKWGYVWLWHCLEQGGQGQQSAQERMQESPCPSYMIRKPDVPIYQTVFMWFTTNFFL